MTKPTPNTFDPTETVAEIITHGVSARVLRVRPGSSQLLIRLDWFHRDAGSWMPLAVLTPAQLISVGRALDALVDRIPALAPKLGLEPDPALATALARILLRPDA